MSAARGVRDAPVLREAPAVLVVEHDSSVAELARRYLRRAGFAVTTAPDPASATAALAPTRPAPRTGRRPYDAVVVDATMPGLDTGAFRGAAAAALPGVALIVTGGVPVDRNDTGSERLRLGRPYAPRDLVARVRAATGRVERAPACAAGPVTLDPGERTVRVHGACVALTGTEFDLLAYLMAHPGRVHSRPHLLDTLWPAAGRAGVRTVDVHIAQIRAKLGAASPIRTIRGVGYVADPGRNVPW